MTLETKPKPWQRRSIRPRQSDVVVADSAPLAQITIYADLTVLTRRTATSWRQYPISADGLAQVLSGVPTASGLLPRHTLGTGRVNGIPFYVLYVPPMRATLRLEAQDFDVPLPPLVWAGCGADYRIFALNAPDYPDDTKLPLLVAPFPNCYRDGRVCWGTADGRPLAAPQTLPKVLPLFLTDSYFNLHLANGKSVQYPTSVIARWRDLVDTQAESYPLDDLMPAECQLGWILSGAPWGGYHG